MEMELILKIDTVVEALKGVQTAIWYVGLMLVALCGITITKR